MLEANLSVILYFPLRNKRNNNVRTLSPSGGHRENSYGAILQIHECFYLNKYTLVLLTQHRIIV